MNKVVVGSRPVAVTKTSDFAPALSKEFLDIQVTIEVGQDYLTINELSKKSNDQNFKIANELHCQFGHASPEKLKKLIKVSNVNDQNYIS